jgi:penicillin-binding protein 1A
VIVGGTNYGRSQFNRATQSKRQPGSSIKPYVYLTAIQAGMKPTSRIYDGPISCGRWSPKNYTGRYHGWIQLQYALKKSLNTVAVRISQKYGRKKVIANLRKAGITHIRPSCSMALGDQGVTLLQHTAGYASFANGGLRAVPYGVLQVWDSADNLLYSREKNAKPLERIFERKHVAYLNQMLTQVTKPGGTARRAGLDFTETAGKTGTTSSYRDAWFMGFSGRYVTGVWYGNDNYKPTRRVTGGSVPGETWHEYMARAHLNPDIPRIPGLKLHPKQVALVKRLKALRKENPGLGSQVGAVRGLSKKTENVLNAIANMMKDAKPLEPVINRNRAALEALPSNDGPTPQ